jgi:rubrerythrin
MRIGYAAAAIAAIAALGTMGATASAMASSSSPAPASVRANAFHAARTESAAYQQYFAYATAADRSGHPELAGAWQTVGTVEYYDHWMGDTALAGKYQSTNNATNLKVAISQAKQTATADLAFAAKAPQGSPAASVLRTVAARETADAKLLQQALNGSVPSAPAVTTVSIQVSAKPHFSGSFYNDLTGGANSALSDAALNWGEYQFFARNAVNTGQAKLAQLLSGLEAQEQDQNWPAISNAAGYVSGNAANLRTSIASEQGAIQMYTRFAAAATKAGDPSAASMFIEVRGDEMGHHQTFTTELHQLTGK